MKKKSLYQYIPILILLILMYIIHQYVFLYADDLYYSRDAQIGLSYLPDFMLKQLNLNGRVWVHVVLLFLVKYDALLFRIVNPIIICSTALLIAKISFFNTYHKNKKTLFITTLVSCLLFLCIPYQISRTTTLYAACSLNYLYPTTVALLFGYMLYKYYSIENNTNNINWLILVIAFFAGSSTQQTGMISIGFGIMISIYYLLVKKYRFNLNYIFYILSLFIGYSFVTYGSLKRMLFEENSGVVIKLTDTITSLLKSNIFSKPVSLYVMLICLCSILFLTKLILNKNINNRIFKFFNTSLILVLIVSMFSYLYIVLVKNYDVIIFTNPPFSTNSSLFYVFFTFIYLFTLLYISILILRYNKNSFILFCVVNAIGAQIMLLVADSRFAETYKVIFPSLLLMFIYITYILNDFYYSKFFSFNKVIFALLSLGLILVSVRFYSQTYSGYKTASKEIVYNLNAVMEYQNSSDKSTLTLKKVPPSLYGYNLGNWNTLPLFMKQCYKISTDTIINYIE